MEMRRGEGEVQVEADLRFLGSTFHDQSAFSTSYVFRQLKIWGCSARLCRQSNLHRDSFVAMQV